MSQANKPPDFSSTFLISLLSLGVVVFILLASEGTSGIWYVIALLSLFTVIWVNYIYKHAKAYGRNAVAWATAFVFFSPLWAGIAYLLTWPKDASEMRQRQIEKDEIVEQHCPKCGSKINRKAKFCAECGVNLIEYEATDWQCEECGGEIGKDDKFCITCGVEFARDREEIGTQDSK